MHIVSRRTMLALPVERLVGNSSHSQHGHHRPPMTMSPDSSASDSSNSDSSPTTNAKVFSSYASQLLQNNNNNNSSSSININNSGSVSPPPQPQTCNNSPKSIVISSIPNNTRTSDESTHSNSTTPTQSPPRSPISMSMPTMSSSCLSNSETLIQIKDIKTSPHHSPSSTYSNYSFEDSHREDDEDNGKKNNHNNNSMDKTKAKSMTLLSSTKDEMKEIKEDKSGETQNCTRTTNTTTINNNNNNTIQNRSLSSQNADETSALTVSPSSSSVSLHSSSQKLPIRLIEDEVRSSPNNNNSLSKMNNGGDESGDENDGICGRPPSRRPSSSCSSTTTSTSTSFPISPNPNSKDSLNKTLTLGNSMMISRPHQQQLLHHHLYHRTSSSGNGGNGNSLKFSIDDILRPEFGKVAIQRINRLSSPPPRHDHDHHHHQRRSSANSTFSVEHSSDSSPYNNNSSSNNNSNNQRNHHKDANNEVHSHSPHNCHSTATDEHSQCSNSSNNNKRHSHRGPSSIKDHSEDSNSSCTSLSRREEVVDETKVNPKVPQGPLLWPAWVYCTRYSDRPSSGPRSRRVRKREASGEPGPVREQPEEKRPRTAFTADQLQRLKQEFDENRYLTEKRRQDLARDLKLHENQIKIWFQNKRAKLKKSSGSRNGLALQLMAQGLYNHSTVPIDEDDEMYEAMMQQQ